MAQLNFGKIATITGRYWAMDRDKRWDRVCNAFDAIAAGKGITAGSGEEAMAQSYAKGEMDEFVKPTVIVENGKPVATVESGDAIVFFNFRPDRAREITRAFIEPDFADFERSGGYRKVCYVCMTQYDATFENVQIAFKPQSLHNTLGQYLADKGLTQLRIAETEKYAHVTFFFNGGVEAANAGEDRALINSPKVATYDLKPEMSAYEVADEAVRRIQSGKYDVMILNFANCDMVGHTGVLEAAVKAVETVDICVGKVVDAILAQGGRALITADHGNADQMVDPVTGGPFTAHTTFPVPLILADDGNRAVTLKPGRLADLAPTMLDLMGIEKPAEMDGTSLVVR
jgi:2,3-bisphosphoglycerate-independent phosphoglycerate mutase